MSKTAILYSPEGGSVNGVALKLGEIFGTDKVDIIAVKEAQKGDVEKYSQIIFVGSTVGADHWSNEAVEDEWQEFFTKIGEVSLEDKKCAIIGLGNSVLYPEHFADGIAQLYNEITRRNGRVYGFVDQDDYTFEDSEALNDDGLFCGLPLDEDNEDDLTDERLENWISGLKTDFEF